MASRARWAVLAGAVLAGCAGTAGEAAVDSEVLVGVAEAGTVSSELSAGVPVGSVLETTDNLNLRTGAGVSHSIRLVIPSGSQVITVSASNPGGWYNVKYNGVTGWSYGGYLALVSLPSSGSGASSARAAAVARAQSGVGFSYWWGHGRWIPNGATSSAVGACTGSCPSCTHVGSSGADCSGYLGKVWQVPSSNADATVDQHPYSTLSFLGANSQWSAVSRAAVQPGDALVYNSNGAGHIFLYESGDGWGSMWAYEAKGCAYGIVHDLRTASTAYQAIARAGY